MRHVRLILTAGVLAGLAAPATMQGQLPGQPVLQNAFANPGWAFGVNYGDGSGSRGYAGAVSWGTGGGSFAVSGGAGLWDPELGESVFAWGGRAMWSPLRLLDGRLGIAAFAGAGAARQDGVDFQQIPAGVSVSYRTAIGGTRGISFYGAPFFRLSRADPGADPLSDTHVRGSVGVDVALARSIGVTLGYEFGQNAKAGEIGPDGGILGIGVSYVPR